MLAFFRQAIALRHAHPVLRHGRYETLNAQAHCCAFARSDAHETLIVVINAGEQTANAALDVGRFFGEGANVKPIFGQGSGDPICQGQLAVSIPPRTPAVFSQQS
jgi:pullulanase/glycogen debranching enzyme